MVENIYIYIRIFVVVENCELKKPAELEHGEKELSEYKQLRG